MLLCITGCTDKPDKATATTEIVETTSEELVSEEYFLEYYGLTREDIGDFDLQAMIDEVGITKEVLEKDGDYWVNRVYSCIESGKQYGYNAYKLTEEGRRQATKEDDISTAKYVLMSLQILKHDGFHHTQQIIIDLEKRKSYYSDFNVWNYFYDAEIQKDLEQETIDKLMNSLEEKKIYKWEASNGPTGDMPGDYIWNLYIVMAKGDVITYSGNNPGNNDMLDSWYKELLEVVK